MCTCAETCSWDALNKYCICGNTGKFDCSINNQCTQRDTLGNCDGDFFCSCIYTLDWDKNAGRCRCARGFHSPTGDHPCTACQPGEYMNNVAGTGCLTCSPGKYMPYEAAPECVNCAPGNYTSNNGMRTKFYLFRAL